MAIQASQLQHTVENEETMLRSYVGMHINTEGKFVKGED